MWHYIRGKCVQMVVKVCFRDELKRRGITISIKESKWTLVRNFKMCMCLCICVCVQIYTLIMVLKWNDDSTDKSL